ncbi:MAG: polysaccharide deacetylase family protein [Candidatus Sumerlaeaceae bacterium]
MQDDRATVTLERGCVVRGPRDRKRIALEFTGGSFADGGTTILRELKARGIRASFFFIGDFYREPKFKPLIEKIRDEGHYLGPHSDKHPLYASWENPPRLLISREEFLKDLRDNMSAISSFGIAKEKARYFIPPYEHYTLEIAQWTSEEGLVLVNYTPGARSHADYMEDKDPKFISAPDMVKSVLDYESSHSEGLNGFMLLMHIGAGPGRTRDHLYDYLGSMLDELITRGYSFVRIDHLVESH